MQKCTAKEISFRTTYREHNSCSDKQGLGITSHLSTEGKDNGEQICVHKKLREAGKDFFSIPPTHKTMKWKA